MFLKTKCLRCVFRKLSRLNISPILIIFSKFFSHSPNERKMREIFEKQSYRKVLANFDDEIIEKAKGVIENKT